MFWTAGEARGHEGGAHVGRVETHRAARSVGGSHSLRNQRPPRPVQTGGGRSDTPSSTQLVSLGRPLLFG